MMLLLRGSLHFSRLLSARLIHCHGHLSVIVAYAPTEDAADTDKDAFYNDLASVIESVPNHDNLLMLGDFNAVTGPRSAGYEDVVGPFGAGNSNNNSLRLLSLCSSHGLIVSGSWFRRLNVHRWTWASDDGRTKKKIDHFSTKDTRSIKSYRVFRGAEAPTNTDHFLTVAKFAVQPQFKRRLKCTRRFDSGKLRHDLTTASTYAIALSNRYEALDDLPDDVESAWSSVRDSFRLAAEETLGFVKPHRRPWLTSDTLEILEKKSAARRANSHHTYLYGKVEIVAWPMKQTMCLLFSHLQTKLKFLTAYQSM